MAYSLTSPELLWSARLARLQVFAEGMSDAPALVAELGLIAGLPSRVLLIT
jgi:hypothetical protein